MSASCKFVSAARMGAAILMMFAAGCGAGGKARAPEAAGAALADPETEAQAPATHASADEMDMLAHRTGHTAAAEPAPVDTETLVQASLLADVAQVAPGQTFAVAARFDIAPGWHLYWENPGESGLATDMELAVPAGFVAGPVRYPGPVRFESPGPVVSYGYAGQVLLSAEVRAPASLAEEAYTFSAQTSWLACKDACVRGRAEVALRIPAATGRAPAAPANQDVFAAHAARLPRPWAALAGARHEWEAGPALVLAVPGAADLAFFPAADNQLALASQETRAGAQETVLRLRYEAGRQPSRAHGVLAVVQDGRTAFYAIDIPRP